jgi:hypothetical protein
MAATNGCLFVIQSVTKRPSGSPRQGNRTLSTIPQISHSTKTITSIIIASRQRERERERERKKWNFKEKKKEKAMMIHRDRDREIYLYILWKSNATNFADKKRVVDGTMKSQAPERGNQPTKHSLSLILECDFEPSLIPSPHDHPVFIERKG